MRQRVGSGSMFLPFQVIKAYFVMLLQNLTLKFSKIKAERIMKETYRAYNSRDELDRVFRVGPWSQGRISRDFLLSSFHQGFSYRSGGRELVCATVKNWLKFAS